MAYVAVPFLAPLFRFFRPHVMRSSWVSSWASLTDLLLLMILCFGCRSSLLLFVASFCNGMRLDIYAYVTLVAGEEPTDELRTALKLHVRKEIGPIASPGAIHWAPALPKTRSGKIMRRILRIIAKKGKGCSADDFGDTSTLADESVVGQLVESYGD